MPEETRDGLFISQEVAAGAGERVLTAAATAGMEACLVVHDRTSLPGAGDLAKITCALLSVDVIGQSSKTYLEPELATFVETLRAAPRLKWLQVCSAGMDRPFYGELAARGVRLSSGTGTMGKAVAQTAVTGVLALSRRVPMWKAAQREHRWQPMRGTSSPPALEGQHAVVVGMGPIGLAIGRILAALELRVTGIRRTPSPQLPFERVRSYDQLDEVLPDADWLVLCCPLSETTRHLIDSNRLALLKPAAHIVNVARGEVIDELALVNALQRGTLAGAHLDVFAVEPLPPDSALWDMPNVIISPHIAGSSSAHQRNVIDLFERNLTRFHLGERLINESANVISDVVGATG